MLMTGVSMGNTEPAMPGDIIHFEKDFEFASLVSSP
jgi:hypothetical protein